MRCPQCGDEVPEGNRYCGKCGSAVEPPLSPRQTVPPAADNEDDAPAGEPAPPARPEPEGPEGPETPGAPEAPAEGPAPPAAPQQASAVEALTPTDTTDTRGEREVWRGRYSNRAALGGLLLTLAAALVASIISAMLTLKFWRKEGGTHWLDVAVWVVAAALVAALLVRVLWRWGKHRFTLRYRLTTERLFIDRGLFNRVRDEIELIRVDDVRVKQTLLDRIFKVGSVEVVSTDRSHPDLTLLGIDEPDAVKEKIRQYTRARRKHSLHVESL